MSGFAICHRHGKEMFASEEAALGRLEQVKNIHLAGSVKIPKRAYYEPECGFWHLTSMDTRKRCHLCESLLTLRKMDNPQTGKFSWEFTGDHLMVPCAKHGRHHAGSYQSTSCLGVEKMCRNCWHSANEHRLPSGAEEEIPIPVLICPQCPDGECCLKKNHRR